MINRVFWSLIRKPNFTHAIIFHIQRIGLHIPYLDDPQLCIVLMLKTNYDNIHMIYIINGQLTVAVAFVKMTTIAQIKSIQLNIHDNWPRNPPVSAKEICLKNNPPVDLLSGIIFVMN